MTMNGRTKDLMNLYWTVFLLLYSAWYFSTVEGTTAQKKCLKDATLPEYDVNIYYCDPDKECCTKDNQFTCCEPSSKSTWRNQVIIFACCFGFILLVFIIWMIYRKDCYCCEKPLYNRPCCFCCCCCRNREDDGDEKVDTISPGPGRQTPAPPYVQLEEENMGEGHSAWSASEMGPRIGDRTSANYLSPDGYPKPLAYR